MDPLLRQRPSFPSAKTQGIGEFPLLEDHTCSLNRLTYNHELADSSDSLPIFIGILPNEWQSRICYFTNLVCKQFLLVSEPFSLAHSMTFETKMLQVLKFRIKCYLWICLLGLLSFHSMYNSEDLLLILHETVPVHQCASICMNSSDWNSYKYVFKINTCAAIPNLPDFKIQGQRNLLTK